MALERAQLFGHDLALREVAGNLDLSPVAAGDLGLAEDNDNIVQALQLRLRVRQGELAALGWPDYGSRLHELIGEPNVTRIHARAIAFARAAIEQDPRVAQVNAVTATVLPGERESVRLQADILLIDTQNPLNLVFDVLLQPA